MAADGRQDDSERTSAAKREQTTAEPPMAGAPHVTLSVPASVEVTLVDARTLSDYEIWAALTTILSSVVVGFFIAAMQASVGQRALYLIVLAVFTALMLAAGLMAIHKRRQLRGKVRRITWPLNGPRR